MLVSRFRNLISTTVISRVNLPNDLASFVKFHFDMLLSFREIPTNSPPTNKSLPTIYKSKYYDTWNYTIRDIFNERGICLSKSVHTFRNGKFFLKRGNNKHLKVLTDIWNIEKIKYFIVVSSLSLVRIGETSCNLGEANNGIFTSKVEEG